MMELNVRIEDLPPMRVARVRAVSEHPEADAWQRLAVWAAGKGYLGDPETHPVFGFNHPAPSPGRPEYGYEFWLRVTPDTPPDDGVDIQDVPGGRYAVLTHHGLPDPLSWRRLWNWVQASPHTWRDTHELERPRDPLAPPDRMVFDLMLPIDMPGDRQ